MNNIKRLCRVCMVNEWNGKLIPIFGDQASDIFIISGVEIIDLPSCPALICSKCIEDLSKAIHFRNRCKSTDKFIRGTIQNVDKAQWNNDLSDLNEFYGNFELKNEHDVLNGIKVEPVDVESIFDYPTINAEAILNEESTHQNGNEEFVVNEYKTMSGNSENAKKEFTCDFCGKMFALRKKYIRHCLTAHQKFKEPDGDIGCHYCFKYFESKSSLKDHIRYKHEVDEFSCDVCGKSFKTKTKLTRHLKEVHKKVQPRRQRVKKEPKPKEKQCFPCVMCGKICSTRTFLKVHERSHIKIKPEDYYYCDVCGNKFKTKRPLEMHIKIRHILKLRYTCDKCPGKSWARNDHMKRHVKIVHDKIREFRCEWCGKDFPEKRKLECHIRIHTGEQPFACQFCGKKYTHETDYRRHIWLHTGERKYKCISCRTLFNKRSELIAHRSECIHYNYYQNHANVT